MMNRWIAEPPVRPPATQLFLAPAGFQTASSLFGGDVDIQNQIKQKKKKNQISAGSDPSA